MPRSHRPSSDATILVIDAIVRSPFAVSGPVRTAEFTLSEAGKRPCHLLGLTTDRDALARWGLDGVGSPRFFTTDQLSMASGSESGMKMLMVFQVPKKYKTPLVLRFRQSKQEVQVTTFEEWKKSVHKADGSNDK
jgi:hypothetical protein